MTILSPYTDMSAVTSDRAKLQKLMWGNSILYFPYKIQNTFLQIFMADRMEKL
jgi:hypothetical protein